MFIKLKNLKVTFKIVVFIVLYTAVFYFFRTSSYYNLRLLLADLGGIPWLYATIGSIFGIISAFIIQKEWTQWSNLEDAVKSEVQALNELWLWTANLPEINKTKIRQAIIDYLKVLVSEGWKKTEAGQISQELENALIVINSAISEINVTNSNQYLVSTSFKLFSNLTRNRTKRMRYSVVHMPQILRQAFRYATVLMIVLSPFIVIKKIEIHYLFTASIALLSYIIYVVADDLDHPLRPGGWHLTTKDYKTLLKKLETNHNSK
ncbi:MAG: hypothetical protein WCW26_04610 [Candidatus Buchananbacteria bacterium]